MVFYQWKFSLRNGIYLWCIAEMCSLTIHVNENNDTLLLNGIYQWKFSKGKGILPVEIIHGKLHFTGRNCPWENMDHGPNSHINSH